jgi:hypothetical protein
MHARNRAGGALLKATFDIGCPAPAKDRLRPFNQI